MHHGHSLGCFSKDQVYLDGILRILRHRRTIDFKMLTSLGKVSLVSTDHKVYALFTLHASVDGSH